MRLAAIVQNTDVSDVVTSLVMREFRNLQIETDKVIAESRHHQLPCPLQSRQRHGIYRRDRGVFGSGSGSGTSSSTSCGAGQRRSVDGPEKKPAGISDEEMSGRIETKTGDDPVCDALGDDPAKKARKGKPSLEPSFWVDKIPSGLEEMLMLEMPRWDEPHGRAANVVALRVRCRTPNAARARWLTTGARHPIRRMTCFHRNETQVEISRPHALRRDSQKGPQGRKIPLLAQLDKNRPGTLITLMLKTCRPWRQSMPKETRLAKIQEDIDAVRAKWGECGKHEGMQNGEHSG